MVTMDGVHQAEPNMRSATTRGFMIGSRCLSSLWKFHFASNSRYPAPLISEGLHTVKLQFPIPRAILGFDLVHLMLHIKKIGERRELTLYTGALKIPQSCEADPADDADNPFHHIGSEYETHRSYKRKLIHNSS